MLSYVGGLGLVVAVAIAGHAANAAELGTEAQRNCFAAAATVEAVSKQAKTPGAVSASVESEAKGNLRKWGMSVLKTDKEVNVFTLRTELTEAVKPLVEARVAAKRKAFGGAPDAEQAKQWVGELQGEMQRCQSQF